jgi:hypothetical protein
MFFFEGYNANNVMLLSLLGLGAFAPDWFNRYQQTGMIAFECGDRISPTP